MSRDIRQRIFKGVMGSRELTPAQQMFMMAVLTLRSERIDGTVRFGSKAMGPDGKFTLHLDYLARALNTSPDNVKYLRRGCQSKGYLSEVHRGTHGRPSCYQALVVRGKESYGVTFREILTPYVRAMTLTRGEKTPPLTYKTPDQGDHAPNWRVPTPAVVENKAHRQGTSSSSPLPAPAHVCEWHEHTGCPADCANFPDDERTAS
ncbi:hypothetical protein [Nocardioides pocheonensis]|uniref:hypothetical protein n=1 Tax=Nocardioides pocheonensis TaxID=661485 RepID=UPI001C83306D|nr:hypothetical protein [Nocardioides pocheonensis]